jgi:hypothetical protein
MKRMMNEYLACREQYPTMSDTWKKEYNFSASQPPVKDQVG